MTDLSSQVDDEYEKVELKRMFKVRIKAKKKECVYMTYRGMPSKGTFEISMGWDNPYSRIGYFKKDEKEIEIPDGPDGNGKKYTLLVDEVRHDKIVLRYLKK